MKSKDELKEIDFKKLMSHYFDDIMVVRDIYSGDNLLDENLYKKYENVSIYDISYKNFMGSKPMRIRLDKIDEFIKIYNGIRYLLSLGHSWYDDYCY